MSHDPADDYDTWRDDVANGDRPAPPWWPERWKPQRHNEPDCMTMRYDE